MEHSYNKGIYTTMITPYKKDGGVDYDTARKYVRWYAENDCDGIFAVCQSSEIFFLSEDERAELNRLVWEETRKIEKETGKRMTIVSSGHVSDRLKDQVHELNRVLEGGTDALILITNRLAAQDEDDDVWIANAEKLLRQLPADVDLGLYECPYPYKRLLTPKILRWCLSTGRFAFIKDTCCDAAVIRERLDILRGSRLMLFNANGQTLLDSMQAGAAGYCGVMANFHPRVYEWLYRNYEKQPEKAEFVSGYISVTSSAMADLPYPLNAKYHMCLEGIPTETTARNRPNDVFTPYYRLCTEQMKATETYVMQQLGLLR